MGQGVPMDNIKRELFAMGWPEVEVFEGVKAFQPKNIRKYLLIFGISLLLLFLVLGGLYFFMNKAVCGNGELEEGETFETCCEDAGCLGDQTCEDTGCVDPTCGTCEYLNNHICFSYTCCDDLDCDDFNNETIDSCINPSTISSECNNTLIVIELDLGASNETGEDSLMLNETGNETETGEDNQTIIGIDYTLITGRMVCTFDTDCPGSDTICAIGWCYDTPEETYGDIHPCCDEAAIINGNDECDWVANYTSEPMVNCSYIPCDNCEDRVYRSCISSLRLGDTILIDYCGECIDDFDCKTGYVCEHSMCIPE